MTAIHADAVLSALHHRNSHARLSDPGPCEEQLAAILTAGLRAPDHGRLRPWQFRLITGERRGLLGEVFEQALLLRSPDASDAERRKARNAPLRAPLIIAGLLKPQVHPKVPRVEQVAAVACALHAMSIAAEAMGFGGIWRTGHYARDPWVIEQLGGGAGDEVIGFLYLGTPDGPKKPIERPEMSRFVSLWP